MKVPSPAPAPEEVLDERYRCTYNTFLTLPFDPGWSPTREVKPLYAFVDRSDAIYQTFVSHVLAAALALEPQQGQPSFASANTQLYTDVVPPRAVARSWRSLTPDPDHYRPDILIHAAGGEIALGDAKYRSDGPRCSESSRKEVMAYMSAFGVNAAIVFFPPEPASALGVHLIEHDGRRLVEVTIAPHDGLAEFLAGVLPGVLQATFVTPPWRD